MEKFRSSNFNLVLYEEDESHRQAIDYIVKNYDYAMILHDSDTDSNGAIKKEHYHIVLRFNNQKWNTALAKELGITENYIEECRNLKRSLLYLIHYYDKDKFQYDIKSVSGSLKNRLVGYIQNEDKTESEKVLEIIEYIENYEGYINVSLFCKSIAKMGYWDVLRRSTGLILKIIEEHNKDML